MSHPAVTGADIRVRGFATDDEIAAVLAALVERRHASRSPQPTSYERWRRQRLAALRRDRSRR
jgi:hypothetical protein